MESFWPNFLSASLAVAVVLGLLSSAVYLGRAWLTERITRSVGHSFDIKLEQFRSDTERAAAQQIEVQSAANSVMVATHQVAAEWRIKSVDALWRQVVTIREKTANPLTMLDILLPAEYQGFVKRKDLRDSIPKLADNMDILDPSVEEVRPFLSDKLFLLFFLYRATMGRIWGLLEKGIEDGHIKPWFEDEPLKRNLRQVFSQEEMVRFEGLTSMHVLWTRTLLEGKILGELREIIAGTNSTVEGIEQADKIRDAIETVRRNSQQTA